MTIPDFDIRPNIIKGDPADIYLFRTLDILRSEGMNPEVTMEFYPKHSGVLCGVNEVRVLLDNVLPESDREVWGLEEGRSIDGNEVALRITARYATFGLYETSICGILSSCTGWATAANKCVEAGRGKVIIATGARHIHPNVAALLDYSSIVGGCSTCSTGKGARLAGVTPFGDMPHALPLIFGDTVKAAEAYDKYMGLEVQRIILVDTFKDEAEEAINVAQSLRQKLRGIRLDSPLERGGVTPPMVKEIRTRLDRLNFRHVEIYVSGGMTPDKIGEFAYANAPVDGFLVGSYISGTAPNDFTADIHEINGHGIAKRGRIPGRTESPRLSRML